MKQRYYNDVVAQTVTNSLSTTRIVHKNNRLYRLSDPVFYTDHPPAHWFDYRSPLYVPVKHFAGMRFTTFGFNLAVIWLMTVLMALALYGGWLKKLMEQFAGTN